jgi:hypothetical protein
MIELSNLSRVVETGDHFKNGAILKSQMSRKNLQETEVFYVSTL